MFTTIGACSIGFGIYGLYRTHGKYNDVQKSKTNMLNTFNKPNSCFNCIDNDNIAIIDVYKQTMSFSFDNKKLNTVYDWTKIFSLLSSYKYKDNINVISDPNIQPLITKTSDIKALVDHCSRSYDVHIPLHDDGTVHKLTYQKVGNGTKIYRYNNDNIHVLAYSKDAVINEVHKHDDDDIITCGFGSIGCIIIGSLLIFNKH